MSWLGRSAAGRRARRWTARPARPVWYGPVARVADAFCGWRDGRRGLPSLTSPGPSSFLSTQRLAEVRGAATVRISNEELSSAVHENAIKAGRTAARSQLEQCVAQAEDDWSALSDARKPPSEHELNRRGLGESDLPETEVRRRRLADHERRQRAAEARYAEARQAVHAAQHELEALDEVLVTHRTVGLLRKRRIDEHASRRSALYWRHVVRVHPDAGKLNDRLTPAGPDLPPWSKEADIDDAWPEGTE
jgi:hypothetical protein